MVDADRIRWDRRHVTAGPDRPSPPEAVIRHLDWLPIRGRALDIACGRGGVAVWLAIRGLTVDALDISPVALEEGRELSRQHAVDERVTFTHWDLDAGLPGLGSFDVVICQRFRAPDLYPRLVDALRPGGLLVVSVLSEAFHGPGAYVAAPNELMDALGGIGLEVLWHDESTGLAHLVARAPTPAGS